MNCKHTQRQAIINLLKKRWATGLDALMAVGTMKLATRVGEIKKDGLKVIDKWVVTETGKRVKSYRIVGG